VSAFSEKVFKSGLAADVTSPPTNDWGLASLLLGGVLILMAPLMMIVMILAVAVGGPRWNPSEVRVISLVFSVPLLCLLGLGVLGFVAAINGIRAARQRYLSVGQAVTGLVMCIVAILFSLINLVSCFIIAEDLMRFRR
jgi:hypothetical protein